MSKYTGDQKSRMSQYMTTREWSEGVVRDIMTDIIHSTGKKDDIDWSKEKYGLFLNKLTGVVDGFCNANKKPLIDLINPAFFVRDVKNILKDNVKNLISRNNYHKIILNSNGINGDFINSDLIHILTDRIASNKRPKAIQKTNDGSGIAKLPFVRNLEDKLSTEESAEAFTNENPPSVIMQSMGNIAQRIELGEVFNNKGRD